MGHATSSALRTDGAASTASLQGAANDAYGSLAGLGAPKKFKKKPVLVLDPEELAKAHAMFQDAQADILGAERPAQEARPSSLLGLAPISEEDDAEDMGVEDESTLSDEDYDIPSAEEVLKMTEGRSGLPPEDEAMQAQALEDGFHEETRIFPTLPVLSDDEMASNEPAELHEPVAEDAEAAAEPVETFDEEPVAETPEAEFTEIPVPAIDEHSTDEEPPVEASAMQDAPIPEEPVEEMREASADDAWAEDDMAPATPPRPSLFERMSAMGEMPLEVPEERMQEPAPVEPTEPMEETAEEEPTPVADLPAEQAEHDAPQSIGADDYGPEPEEAVFEEPAAFDETETEPVELAAEDEWQTDEQADSTAPETDTVDWSTVADEAEAVPEPVAAEAHPDEFAAPAEEEYAPSEEYGVEEPSNVETYDEDEDSMDGYAFMYANNPRGRVTRLAPQGSQNSLRAKLVKDRDVVETGGGYDSPSLLARFTDWVRGLFNR
ncbi:hypothetical protein [Aurantiacibacter gangjinensis]|uniref:Uncharacterized protein n=1 Tax=Aurantiacibacter gangjinensis TaxID=502682 RepID=A0A0G9MQZ9_9SPHN|nr:hypothetical protein [Aurantiacibacter gangjinensis]APE29059.1 hypothetical protein BMF35_a2230 [Aurantiacibacter gangjinensis]KLE33151.1 hypothetical protein AAW01_04010 [Aurantiacibacter gangjinensis]